MPNKDLATWLEYIQTLHVSAIDLDLQRILPLAQRLQLTHFNCPVITVAGTNGKGSCLQFLQSIYLAAGYSVATYTSPHLQVFNERLQINGQFVSDQQLVDAFEYIESQRGEVSLSFFEFTTLAILNIIKQQAVDVVLLEVGLGGRLDAVNVVEPDVAIVSSISLDHIDWLGPDRESIGFEKAGIFRANKPAICADLNPPESLRQRAADINASWLSIGEHYNYVIQEHSWQWQSEQKTYPELPLPNLHIHSASASLMAVECLQPRLPVSQKAVQQGIAQAQLPGRYEQISELPNCLCDVAHNPAAMQQLAERLSADRCQGRTICVLGMLADKLISESLAQLQEVVDLWLLADLTSISRGASAQQLSANLAQVCQKKWYTFATVADAFSHAIELCGENDRILVCGSFHTVAQAKELISRTEKEIVT